jgi:hypothetical protein
MTRYFAYVHEKNRKLVITDEDGKHLTDMLEIPESTSIRQQAIGKLKELGYSPMSRWNEFSHYSYAEIRKNSR